MSDVGCVGYLDLGSDRYEIKDCKARRKIANLFFNSIEDMKACPSLENGNVVQTLGYYEENDGGNATYLIRTKTENDIEDNGSIHFIGDSLVGELISNEINCKMFGAKDTQNEDQSDYIIKAINFCFAKGIKELKLNGNYYVNSIMLFTSKNNLKISNGTFYVHETNELLNTDYNILQFNNCDNIIINNIRFIELNPVEKNRKLQVGGLLFNTCNNCSTLDCYFENTTSGIMFVNTNNSIIKNNLIFVNEQSSQFSQSAILNYASKDNNICFNKIYGEFYDGVLSIFGDSSNVIVESNELYNKIDSNEPFYLSQGITIDSGVTNCICNNNIVKDMFYGIDNKSDTKNTLISNNILEGNKVSIADRNGENVLNGVCFNTTIINNKINIKEDYNTNNLGNYLHYEKYYFIGILAESRSGIKIKNNDISLIGTISKKICGICAGHNINLSNQYILVCDISSNNIEFSTGHGIVNSNAPSDSTCIVIDSIKKATINNNTFKVDNLTANYSMIEFRNDNTKLFIKNNMCFCTNRINHKFLSAIENATIRNSSIYGNFINGASNLLKLDSLTNIIENEYNEGIVGRQIKTTELVANTWSSVGKFSMPYDGLIQLKLKGIASFSGVKIIDCLYSVYVNGTTVTATEIENNNIDFDIQFISSGNNEITLQIKSNSTFSFSGLYITQLSSTQKLSIIDM